MNKILIYVASLTAAAAIIPAVPLLLGKAADDKPAKDPKSVKIEEFIFNDAQYSDEPYKVLDISSGQVIEVPVRDYVIGAVCAEMPAVFEEEALKAQAVAAHTYAERQRRISKNSENAELKGADFSNDTAKYQGYYTESRIKHYFGENFDEYYKKISDAADEVMNYIITYDNEPIISAFHSMSSGTTESAENVWGTKVDYLVPVDSSFDKSAPKYEDEVTVDLNFMKTRLEEVFGASLGENAEEWIIPAEISDSGTILTARVGDKTVTGNDIRTALGLRSADFEVKIGEDSAIFTTKGFGHGVGMSQYGANSMASKGSNWREILEHYYTGCTITKVEDDSL